MYRGKTTTFTRHGSDKVKKNTLAVLAVCLLLGIMMAVQFRTVQADYLSGMIPSTKLDKLKEELNLLKQEKAALSASLEELQKKLESLAEGEADDNLLIRSLNDELSKYKMLAGFSNVQGPGVAVYIDNAPDAEGEKTHLLADYNLILYMVNELAAAGAEAISINGQRYTSNSEIRGTGTAVVVNGVSVKPPMILKAIGDKNVLIGALEQRFGIVEIIRKRGYQCEVNAVNDLRIDRSNEILNWRFAKPVKD